MGAAPSTPNLWVGTDSERATSESTDSQAFVRHSSSALHLSCLNFSSKNPSTRRPLQTSSNRISVAWPQAIGAPSAESTDTQASYHSGPSITKATEEWHGASSSDVGGFWSCWLNVCSGLSIPFFGSSVGNQQKWDTFVKERSGGNGSVVGLPEQVVVAFAAG